MAATKFILTQTPTQILDGTKSAYIQEIRGSGTINALDCKYSGDPSKMKSGTVNVTNTESLT